MKNSISLLLVILSLLDKTHAQTWKILHGEECVVLNVTQFSQSKGEAFDEYGGDNEEFDNVTDCERAYQYRYGHYPFYNDFLDYKGWLEVKYHCVPCAMVYGEQKKEKDKPGSGKGNAETAKDAKDCFNGNNDSYNDFLNAISHLPDDIYLDKITCKDGELYPEWSKRDEDGNKTGVPENERKPIDEFYDEMKERSEARQVNELARQLKDAQTAKEASELLNQLQEIFKDLNKPNSNSGSDTDFGFSDNNSNSISQSSSDGITSSRDLNSEGAKELMLDTDDDGIADTKVTYYPGEAPVYESVKDGVISGSKSNVQQGQNPNAASNFTSIKKVNTNMSFYADCIKTLDVRGLAGVLDASKQPSHYFLFLVAATVRDAGESKMNAISPSADIGLAVYGSNGFSNQLSGRRLFGPYWEGYDSEDGSEKYEWLDYCSMRYNNFAIADITKNPLSKIHVFVQEGDDMGSKDDVVFDANVSIDEIKKGNNIITGTCDIGDKCATLCFAIESCSEAKNCGIFWSSNIPDNVRSEPGELGKWFVAGGEALRYIFSKAISITGIWPHKWVVISYSDGYCIFNRVRESTSMQEVVNAATGKGGDCDWWPWPEGSKHVCLDNNVNANKLIQRHGKIKNIQWIDHPTPNCGN